MKPLPPKGAFWVYDTSTFTIIFFIISAKKKAPKYSSPNMRLDQSVDRISISSNNRRGPKLSGMSAGPRVILAVLERITMRLVLFESYLKCKSNEERNNEISLGECLKNPKTCLRCPETLFISHENANFLFSAFRVVQGEAKTPKIMGCCRVNFAFLQALKIGTFRGKWTLEWVIKMSHFVLLALYFLTLYRPYILESVVHDGFAFI